ncbi:MAG: DUF192 domain-containing protein, partial [Candidatus Limnocylindrales bacterium]
PLVARNTTRDTLVAGRVAAGGTFWTSFRGLMGRATIDPDEGLWLPGDGAIHMFFMRFAIDCAFLGPSAPDGSRPVVSLRHGLRPWTGMAWARGAGGVLELASGALARSATELGDRIALTEAET